MANLRSILHATFVTLGLAASLGAQETRYEQSRLKKVLILTFNNFHGPTTASTIQFFKKIGADKGFTVDTKFNATDLAQYQVVLFIQNRSFGLDDAQKKAFEDWYKKGRGALCLHACTLDQGWSFYQDALGTSLAPHSDVIETEVTVAGKSHPILKDYGGEKLSWDDEWFYWIKDPRKETNVTVLLTIDFSGFPPQTYPVPEKGVYPSAWIRESNGGKFLTWGATHTTTATTKYEKFTTGFLFNSLKYLAGSDTVTSCPNVNMCKTLGSVAVLSAPQQKRLSDLFGSSPQARYASVKIGDASGRVIYQRSQVDAAEVAAFVANDLAAPTGVKTGLYWVMSQARKGDAFQKKKFILQ
jgi:hypothetical protein